MTSQPETTENHPSGTELTTLPEQIRQWARDLGFADAGITLADTGPHAERLQRWLAAGYHGDMAYMADHGDKRYTPDSLVPGTLRVISVRMDYLPSPDNPKQALTNRETAYITRYALGRDYHKLMRKRLATLAKQIDEAVSGYDYRAFVDSAPVLERGLAQRAGLGWIGKNNMLIHPKAGSYFFLALTFSSGKFSPAHRCRWMSPSRNSTAAPAPPACARPMPLLALTYWMPAAASAT